MDRDEGRQCRYCPRQYIDHQEPLDPPASAHKEAGEEQRKEHFDVDANSQINDGIYHRHLKDRVVPQFCIESRIVSEPEAVDDRISDKREEDRDIGDTERKGPGVLRALQTAAPSAQKRAATR